eukprot:TRINITY_DN9386_c0_g1_i2.p1 TRINITY_DN9386_c0_g1~~TRINITY_DN9386_c0_g1_i2.p1  ORF type:complete len:214 (-),score=-4.48 TRINITY_DN9386_c0_g1_i2:25-666(-)
MSADLQYFLFYFLLLFIYVQQKLDVTYKEPINFVIRAEFFVKGKLLVEQKNVMCTELFKQYICLQRSPRCFHGGFDFYLQNHCFEKKKNSDQKQVTTFKCVARIVLMNMSMALKNIMYNFLLGQSQKIVFDILFGQFNKSLDCARPLWVRGLASTFYFHFYFGFLLRRYKLILFHHKLQLCYLQYCILQLTTWIFFFQLAQIVFNFKSVEFFA